MVDGLYIADEINKLAGGKEVLGSKDALVRSHGRDLWVVGFRCPYVVMSRYACFSWWALVVVKGAKALVLMSLCTMIDKAVRTSLDLDLPVCHAIHLHRCASSNTQASPIRSAATCMASWHSKSSADVDVVALLKLTV